MQETGEKPLMTPEEVDRRIMSHWFTWENCGCSGFSRGCLWIDSPPFLQQSRCSNRKKAPNPNPPFELNRTSTVSPSPAESYKRLSSLSPGLTSAVPLATPAPTAESEKRDASLIKLVISRIPEDATRPTDSF